MKKELNFDYINKFHKEEYSFYIKTEIAYVIGKDKLDNDFMEFIDNETYIDGIYGFSILVRFLYEEYVRYSDKYWDIYEFLDSEYNNCFEKFKKVCFK